MCLLAVGCSQCEPLLLLVGAGGAEFSLLATTIYYFYYEVVGTINLIFHRPTTCTDKSPIFGMKRYNMYS